MIRSIVRFGFVALFIFFVKFQLFAEDGPFDLSQKSHEIFQEYAKDGLVDYQSLKKDHTKLDEIVNNLAKFDVTKLSNKNQELAFWINAYNIIVLHSVIEAYPIKSPMDVKGFFDQQEHSIGNKKLTLNDIENQIIRPKYKDARIHFALVCAAKGCPILINSAYFGKTLDKQLNEKTKNSLNDNRYVRLDKDSKKVFVTEIFKWYQEDFVAGKGTIIDFINIYREKKIPKNYEVDYISYDWTLNEAIK